MHKLKFGNFILLNKRILQVSFFLLFTVDMDLYIYIVVGGGGFFFFWLRLGRG